jgi:ElaB/YqjD/DUF883 family membrane-anchored ribosome-binding protein
MDKRDDESENVVEKPAASVIEAAKTADRALRDTAQKYLDAAGAKVELKDIEEKISIRPLFYFGIAAAAGFILGGGMAARPGVVLLGLIGRRAARQTATNAGRQLLQKARF